ncbi:unnamed protein product [Ilex paraguariensis]|uniref:Uncharacterized protein n=1 Tax=Ilex paraguariensis TaxID=185542 RepID=A0ABC8R0R3_9AQUA
MFALFWKLLQMADHGPKVVLVEHRKALRNSKWLTIATTCEKTEHGSACGFWRPVNNRVHVISVTSLLSLAEFDVKIFRDRGTVW